MTIKEFIEQVTEFQKLHPEVDVMNFEIFYPDEWDGSRLSEIEFSLKGFVELS